MEGKHGDAVWEVNWVNRGGKGDKGEALVSISSDGRMGMMVPSIRFAQTLSGRIYSSPVQPIGAVNCGIGAKRNTNTPSKV